MVGGGVALHWTNKGRSNIETGAGDDTASSVELQTFLVLFGECDGTGGDAWLISIGTD